MASVSLNQETLKSVDLVLIATDHTNVDYQLVVDHAHSVVDTRNATKRTRGVEKVVRA
jgi:UDP-N-acetyl-D-glucosamine dehydrogenase